MNKIIRFKNNIRNHVNINNYLIPSNKKIMPKGKQMNKKGSKIESNKLKIIADRERRNSVCDDNNVNIN